MLASQTDITWAESHVYGHLRPTPQHAWPLLAKRAGCEVWVKHENHHVTGAFKVRGGLTWVAAHTGVAGLVAATTGNHGQSVAFAARTLGVPATIVVPHGNSAEKNAAMRGFGAELIEYGDDFNAALPHAQELAARAGHRFVPSLDPLLVRGVATAAKELLVAAPRLDALYVPIGLGSGILGAVSAREALGHSVDIVGVVASRADAYAQSFEAGRVVETDSADTFAGGMAVRAPDPAAVAEIQKHVARVVRVEEEEMRAAIRHLLSDTHQLAEGAGAAAFAALMQERQAMSGRRVGVMLSGANLDRSVLAGILAEDG